MKNVLMIFACMLCAAALHAQNVGVGTTTPETILHIAETKTATDGIDGVFVNIQNTTNQAALGSLTGIRFRMDGVGTPENSRFKGGIFFEKTGSWGVGSLHFMNNSSANNNSITMADAKMTVASNGYVGIGTGSLTPLAQLDVNTSASSSATNAYLLRNSNNDTIIRIRNDGKMGMGINTVSSYGRTLNLAGGMNFYNGYDYSGSIFDNSNGSLTIWAPSSNLNLQPSAGTVTIGIATPAAGYLFAVDGKIICEEARVQISGSWPDYVFNSDYQLKPIDELEKQVKELKHLPGMPAAAEVEKEGFDLGNMNKKLLEKVEELTLYIIQINKENKLLNERVSKLEKK